MLFALASMCFAFAIAPFFSSARLAALVGPLAFFLSSQLFNLFERDGSLLEGAVRAKARGCTRLTRD